MGGETKLPRQSDTYVFHYKSLIEGLGNGGREKKKINIKIKLMLAKK